MSSSWYYRRLLLWPGPISPRSKGAALLRVWVWDTDWPMTPETPRIRPDHAAYAFRLRGYLATCGARAVALQGRGEPGRHDGRLFATFDIGGWIGPLLMEDAFILALSIPAAILMKPRPEMQNGLEGELFALPPARVMQMYLLFCCYDPRRLRRCSQTRPPRPSPSRARVPGSGVGTGGGPS